MRTHGRRLVMDRGGRSGGGRRAGFTLVEILVASTLSLLVTTAVLSVFILAGRQAALASRVAWSQGEAMRSADRLTMLIRNAKAVVRIDESQGRWIRLRMTNNEVIRLTYTNLPTALRDGGLLMRRASGTEVIVARGLTEIQYAGGNTPRFFRAVIGDDGRTNGVQVWYRVSEPVASGNGAANDGLYAAHVRMGVHLRNMAEE